MAIPGPASIKFGPVICGEPFEDAQPKKKRIPRNMQFVPKDGVPCDRLFPSSDALPYMFGFDCSNSHRVP